MNPNRRVTNSPLVLAFGDSLTAGYGLPPEQSYPARLEALLRVRKPTATVLNAGVSGDTSGMALARLPRLLAGLDLRPDLAIVEIGPNDVIRRTPAARTRRDIAAILDELDRCRIPALLATITVPTFLAAHADGFEGLLEEVAASRHVPTAPFAPPGVLGNRAMLLADGFHPDAQAMQLIALHLLPIVERRLGEPGGGLEERP